MVAVSFFTVGVFAAFLYPDFLSLEHFLRDPRAP